MLRRDLLPDKCDLNAVINFFCTVTNVDKGLHVAFKNMDLPTNQECLIGDAMFPAKSVN